MKVRGSWVAIPTPFKADGSVDLSGMKRLIDFHAAHRTDGLLAIGSAGEVSMLSKDEKREIIAMISEYARDRIPVLVGTSCSNTRETIEMTRYAREHGAAGALITVPGYVIPPQEAIYQFYRDIADAVDIPIAVYNNPSRLGANIKSETAVRLAGIPGVVCLKEAMPDVGQLVRVKKEVGDRLDILTCDSPAYSIILSNMAMGGAGVTSITGNLAPEEFADMSRPWQNIQDAERCRSLVFKYFELMELCYSVTNPVVIKAGYELLGLPGGAPRLPLQPLGPDKTAKLKVAMEALGLLAKYGKG
jgi:4-hydroxy-tetrahydrodipicolinate synthase